VCGCGGGDSVQSLLTGATLRSSVGLPMDSDERRVASRDATLGVRVVVSCECCLEHELRRARSTEKVGGVPKRRRVGPAERALLLRSLLALCGAESSDAVSGLSECACSAAGGSHQEALSAALSEYTADARNGLVGGGSRSTCVAHVGDAGSTFCAQGVVLSGFDHAEVSCNADNCLVSLYTQALHTAPANKRRVRGLAPCGEDGSQWGCSRRVRTVGRVVLHPPFPTEGCGLSGWRWREEVQRTKRMVWKMQDEWAGWARNSRPG